MANYTFLYIANSHEIGGGNRSLLTIIDSFRLQTDIKQVVFLPAEGAMAAELKKRNVPYSIVPHEPSKNRLSFLIRILRYTLAIKRQNPHLIHANDLFCHKLAGIAGKILRIPVICHMRFSVDPMAVAYYLKPKPRAIIFNSEFTKRSFLDANPVFDSRIRAEVIYNGFDPARYSRPEARHESRASWGVRNEKVIGILGNFAKVKGHELFLQAAQKLLAVRNDLRFVVIGEDILENGRRKNELKELTRSLGIQDSVHFTGFAADPGWILAGLDVLVVPSHFESFGRVAVEGLLAGLPVVASRTGGLVEILDGVSDAYLVPPGEVDLFANAIVQALIDHNRSPEQTREMAEKRFGEAACFKRLLHLYASTAIESIEMSSPL